MSTQLKGTFYDAVQLNSTLSKSLLNVTTEWNKFVNNNPVSNTSSEHERQFIKNKQKEHFYNSISPESELSNSLINVSNEWNQFIKDRPLDPIPNNIGVRAPQFIKEQQQQQFYNTVLPRTESSNYLIHVSTGWCEFIKNKHFDVNHKNIGVRARQFLQEIQPEQTFFDIKAYL